MKHNPAILTADNAADGLTIQAFLQQAVDHYPRLVAFSFTVWLPHSETPVDNRALIMRFHTEVWLRMGEYSRRRLQARRHSSPTILRWLWEGTGAPACRMVLLMNSDTPGMVRETPGVDSICQDINMIINEAWRMVMGTGGDVVNMTSLFISRSGRGAFTAPFSQLQARVQEMMSPVMMARTDVICP